MQRAGAEESYLNAFYLKNVRDGVQSKVNHNAIEAGSGFPLLAWRMLIGRDSDRRNIWCRAYLVAIPLSANHTRMSLLSQALKRWEQIIKTQVNSQTQTNIPSLGNTRSCLCSVLYMFVHHDVSQPVFNVFEQTWGWCITQFQEKSVRQRKCKVQWFWRWVLLTHNRQD